MPYNPSLPATPVDVLQISSFYRRMRLRLALLAARAFKFWDRPLKHAINAAEHMRLRDAYYWVYKSKIPLTASEAGVKDALSGTCTPLAAPDGFIPEATLSFAAAGDLLWSDALEYSRDLLFRNISDLLFNSDICYANFETPVTQQPLEKEVIGDKGPPKECCSLEQFDILKGHRARSFNVLNIANNHIFDMGIEGLYTTIETLSKQGIFPLGVNQMPSDAGKANVLDVNGLKIGFIAATFGLNGRPVPPEYMHKINIAKGLACENDRDLHVIHTQIEDCRRQSCDFIIASLHWGYEFEFFPRKWQVDLAHTIIEWGADAIIGHHPHVIQPIERYQTLRDPKRIAPIAYSLGSLTWNFTAPHLALSAVLKMHLSKGTIGGENRTYVTQLEAFPVFRSHAYWTGKPVTQIRKLSDHQGSNAERHPPEYLREMKRYAKLVLGTYGAC
ncbi:MAG: CapA family protein [Alphaproteobacteria bacterium]|nr:CapA family protein [Alphaproteobacteria bacterium]